MIWVRSDKVNFTRAGPGALLPLDPRCNGGWLRGHDWSILGPHVHPVFEGLIHPLMSLPSAGLGRQVASEALERSKSFLPSHVVGGLGPLRT